MFIMERIELIYDKYPLRLKDGVFPLTSDSVFLAWFACGASGRGIDLGCGAGTIGVLMGGRGADVPDGVDADAAAAELAEQNYRGCGFSARIYRCDVREPLPELRSAYDYCVFNPPYFSGGKAGKLAGARGDALGGADAFWQGCGAFLAPGGGIYFCIRPNGTKSALESLKKQGFFPILRRYVRHSPAHAPFLELIYAERAEAEQAWGEDICIYDEKGRHTPLWHEIYGR